MKKQRQEIRVEQVTPEEQDTLLATQEKQNKIFALVLAGLVLFFFVLTYLVVTKLGIIPMEDQDIFRST
ncbi:hypothetical protein IT571_12345 [Candidatus Sumerlaeota bacterium]|nr:hypothetical protein [Candidatus Sumerlaeota bacterium]HMZ50998.1 hypothetical protein [Candidatus Sumerlaeota bacterium]HNM45379.1 hypothetical protein [Candidatus Sumerlaeota bacterium]